MRYDSVILLCITAALGAGAFLLLGLLITVKTRAKLAYTRKKSYHRGVFHALFAGNHQSKPEVKRPRGKVVVSLLEEITASAYLPAEMVNRLKQQYVTPKIEQRILKNLFSRSSRKRYRAVQLAAVALPKDTVERNVGELLRTEKKWYIKLAAVNTLADTDANLTIEAILQSIPGSPDWYKEKIPSLLEGFGERFHSYLSGTLIPRLKKHEKTGGDPELMEIFLSLAESFPSEGVVDFLDYQVRRDTGPYSAAAAEKLFALRSKKLFAPEILGHPVADVRRYAVKAMQYYPDEENAETVLALGIDEKLYEPAVSALSGMVSRKPELKEHLEAALVEETDPLRRKILVTVLEARIQYYLMNLNTDKREVALLLLEESLLQHRFAALIGFLNRNTHLEIENEVLHVVGAVTEKDPYVREEFSRYCSERILRKLGLKKIEETPDRKKIPLMKRDRRMLILVLLGIVTLPLLLYLTASRVSNGGTGFSVSLTDFFFRYNYFFAFYSFAVNGSYLVLLVFSFVNLFRQKALWKTRSVGYLFKRNILPAVSILSPAYNEEKSIVENVRSLLNLQYPRFEVIVINDGSSDATLSVLIENFRLVRQDEITPRVLQTQAVRGIYKNPGIPNLTIIDKINGGKADSLNAGINKASFSYICTIDADSMLEPEALLNIMYQTVTQDKEAVALGGNILPVNGCEVKNGNIRRVKLGKKTIVRFQTIEYLRAYLAGRLGWAKTNGMLIISGAFGIFSRGRVLEVGGYLTGQGKYRKDTVGEDMELVVRLHKRMRRIKKPYHIGYAFNANCWTEIPESLRMLYRQRDRWHRGLLEILLFHRTMIFNPGYGPAGTFSMPYFVLFEVIGPFFELLGLLVFIVSAVMGLLTLPLVLLLFISVIMLGILISLSAVLISENGIVYFSGKETAIVLACSVAENFGFRQVMSMIRVFAYISFLVKEKGWGTMRRTGFSP